MILSIKLMEVESILLKGSPTRDNDVAHEISARLRRHDGSVSKTMATKMPGTVQERTSSTRGNAPTTKLTCPSSDETAKGWPRASEGALAEKTQRNKKSAPLRSRRARADETATGLQEKATPTSTRAARAGAALRTMPFVTAADRRVHPGMKRRVGPSLGNGLLENGPANTGSWDLIDREVRSNRRHSDSGALQDRASTLLAHRFQENYARPLPEL